MNILQKSRALLVLSCLLVMSPCELLRAQQADVATQPPKTAAQKLQDRIARKQQLVSKLPVRTHTFFDMPYVIGAQPGHLPDSIQTLDLYVPAGAGPFPLIIWIHGGGWHAGDKELIGADLALRFVPAGFALASLNYRFTNDNHPFPAQIEDCNAALTWLRRHAAEYHINPEKVGVVGHSAGAHLSALMACTGDSHVFNKESSFSTRVQAAVLWACPSDLTRTSGNWPSKTFIWNSNDIFIKTFFPAGGYNEDFAAKASPIKYVHSGVPPVLIVHGAKDKSVPVEQAYAFANALKAVAAPVTLRIDPEHGHDVMGDASDKEAVLFFQKTLQGK